MTKTPSKESPSRTSPRKLNPQASTGVGNVASGEQQGNVASGEQQTRTSARLLRSSDSTSPQPKKKKVAKKIVARKPTPIPGQDTLSKKVSKKGRGRKRGSGKKSSTTKAPPAENPPKDNPVKYLTPADEQLEEDTTVEKDRLPTDKPTDSSKPSGEADEKSAPEKEATNKQLS
jgi:hypothetical protein